MDVKNIVEKKILVGVSGSIAVAGIFQYLAMLKANFSEVKVVMTKGAVQLIPAETVKLYCDEVFIDEKLSISGTIGHVELARWADLMAVLPATGNTLSKAAHGLATDLLSTVILAHDKPVIFFPNMNKLMWEKKVVQHNVKLLQQYDHIVVPPVKTTAFEIATMSLRPNYVLPNPQNILNIISKQLEERNRLANICEKVEVQ
ncbi:flavoprotein [Priestia megaterium]|jgi:phosphopantothenoylcysteine decarboxylase/phosphopantothenate--cysteine ligase|uniref:Lantibiotic biosynthesis protein, HFCD family n=7 Tax=Priestia TaxID=2800373 RepID=D5E4G2_PRIM1|nr:MULTISPECIES: flavoprotein [Priestia]KOP69601.1 Mersacidin decarboxylase [Bacillus sp. FJAT-21351]KQU16370.1 Mersacidin decarboxylase [Bacillus sp. Leaf75]MBZ5482440.1 Mersacidin decarboxylase [Bacillus sp. T_4]MDH6656940.1 phosphopantothenoylcysteine synthetase/decarboxylase [Bacillus sp. PvP124]MDP9579546.1 phosphopantothenoylcysteine synthetase/decarboxylase [Bacillus sp. 1751]MEB2277339.1 Mersacidin decarboxylase [Bacillus sp. ILBB4]RFB20884.1 Mersacidin decarboxylase [Bacillus sp. AL